MEVLAALFETEKELIRDSDQREAVMCHVWFLFTIVVNCIMRNTNNRKRGIRWQFMSTLDLDYADDLSLISSNYSNIQEKTTTE